MATAERTLVLLKPDAVARGLIGRLIQRFEDAGKSRNRGPEKVFTDTLGILLIAERAAMLSGRDDEFVAVVTTGMTGIRFGELVGLETEFVRRNSIRIEWQYTNSTRANSSACHPRTTRTGLSIRRTS